jgi:antitoxin HigA-1
VPDYRAHRDPNRPPMHPGELLREVVLPAIAQEPPLHLLIIAKMLGVSRQTFHNILAGRTQVTPAMALRLGKLFGNGPTLWLNLQQAYDLHEEEQRIGDQIATIPTLKAAPVKQPRRAAKAK